MFERAHEWNGLLVEPHPIIFAKVTVQEEKKQFHNKPQGLQVQRKAWSVASCLAVTTQMDIPPILYRYS